MSWHVVYTRPQEEVLVTKRLAAMLGHDSSFCPLVLSSRVHRLVMTDRYLPAYGRYVFANWETDDPHSWHLVSDTVGVAGILGGASPWPVIPGVVEGWLAVAEPNGFVPGLQPDVVQPTLGYGEGDFVRLTYGSFEDVLSYCDWVDRWGTHLQIRGLLGRDLGIYVPFVSGARIVLEEKTAATSGGQALHRKRGRRGGAPFRKFKLSLEVD